MAALFGKPGSLPSSYSPRALEQGRGFTTGEDFLFVQLNVLDLGMCPGLAKDAYNRRETTEHLSGKTMLTLNNGPDVPWVGSPGSFVLRPAKSGSCLHVHADRDKLNRRKGFLSFGVPGGTPSFRIPFCGDLGTDSFEFPGGRPTR